MEKQTMKSPSISLSDILNDVPFIIYSPSLNLTQKDIYKIYKDSDNFSKALEDYEISKEKYKIIIEDEDEDNDLKIINFYKKDKLIESQNKILKTPYEIRFENINEIEEKIMYIFKEEAYTRLTFYLDEEIDKYESIIESDKKKYLLVKHRSFEISKEIFKITLEKNNNLEVLEDFQKKTIKLDLKFLSSNYDTIFTKTQKDEFIFMLNEERINFFNKLNDFINSKKLFYYITGSDGIGKSLSLLYYSSLRKNKFLYLNIKSYYNEANDFKFRNLFYNDIQKLFLFQYPQESDEKINFSYYSYIKSLEKNVKIENQNNNDNIGKIFKYILCFLKVYPIYNYTIILDQYKSDISDPNNAGLNSIIEFIIKHKDKCKIKLIISSSVDNTSNKYVLLSNLSKIYLNSNQTDLYSLLIDESLDNINIYNNENISSKTEEFSEKDDVLDNKDDCIFCENIFKGEKAKREKDLLNKKNCDYFISNSSSLIDKYHEYTIKDYYFALANGKEIFEKDFKENELIMVKMFSYNLKYINKYIDLKNNTKKNSGESDNDFIKRVIQLFYEQVWEKMKSKIKAFYEELYKTNNKDKQYSNYVHMEFQSLCKLRNFIFYEKKFLITDLAQQLLLFPMKYLQIIINDYDKPYFPLDTVHSNYSFKLEYNNDFTRIMINRIINELYKDITNITINSFKGSAEGTYLEIKIDDLFRKKCAFDLNDIESRYLFSLVTNTKNSEKTVRKHRQEEVKLLFFGDSNYTNILIDDIDIDTINKIKKDHYILKGNYYYFSQVSLTGKAFDMCVIVKEKDNNYKLYLFQVSKNKTVELGTYMYYLLQADDVAKNLEKLYGINITERHLIFILPRFNYDNNFLELLKKNNFYYIFFDTYSNEFYINESEKMNHFNFPGSLLNIVGLTDYKKINYNFITWENSMKAYINKKRSNSKSLYHIYINNFYSSNSDHQIKLDLKKINSLLLEKVICVTKSILKFIGNCDINNIEEVQKIYNMIFIFKRNNNIYIYYKEEIYSLKKGKSSKYIIQKINEDEKKNIFTEEQLDENLLKKIPSKKKNLIKIELSDLFDKKNIKYNDKCFCYLVITKEKLTEFYNWWC